LPRSGDLGASKFRCLLLEEETMAVNRDPLKICFRLERSTKKTYKLEEQTESGQPPRIGSLYVQKWVLGEDPPKRITVTVQPESA